METFDFDNNIWEEFKDTDIVNNNDTNICNTCNSTDIFLRNSFNNNDGLCPWVIIRQADVYF